MANDTIIRVTADTTSYISEMEKVKRWTDAYRSSQDAAEKRMQAIRTDAAAKARADLQQAGSAQSNASSAVQQYADTMKSASENTIEFGKKAAGAAQQVLTLANSTAQGDWTGVASSLLSIAANAETMGLLFSAAANPITLAAAALGALTLASIAGARESTAFANSLQLTGNFAGLTEGQFNAMAQSMANAGNFGVGAAREALLSLVSTGKFSGDALADVGSAIVAMARLSGGSTADVTKDFAKMADGVSNWADSFNQSHHFASAAQLAHIQLLEEQGKKQEAMAETGRLLNVSLEESSRNLTGMPSVLRTAGNAWDTFWDKAKGSGRTHTNDDQIKEILDKVTYVNRTAGGVTGISPSALPAFNANAVVELTPLYKKKFTEEQLARDQASHDKIQAEGRAADISNKALADSQKTRPQQGEERIRKYKSDIKKQIAAGSSDVDDEKQQAARIAKITEEYADKKSAKPVISAVHQDDIGSRFLQQLHDQDIVTRALLETNNKLTGAEKQQAEFLLKIDGLKGKSNLTADERSLLAKQKEITAQLEINVNDEKQLKNKQDILKIVERSAQIDAQIVSFQQSQSEQHQTELDAVSMGAEAQKRNGAVKSINKEYEKQQQQLDSATPEDKRNSSEYLDQKKTIQGQLQQSLKEYDKYYATLKEKQGDWRNGAMKAFYDYQDTASNVAAQAGAAFTNVAKGMEDALFNFAMTGKLSFTDMAKSIIADIARMQARAAVSGLFNMAISAIGSYFGGASTSQVGGSGPGPTSFGVEPGNNFTGLGSGFYGISGKASGGLVSGPGTSTSDSVATKLSNGEFVNNAESTKKNRGILEWMNNGGDSSKLGPGEPGVANAGRANAMANVGAAAGAAVNVVTNITISDAGTSSETKGDSGVVGKQIGAMIEQTLKGLLVKELRDGGILSKTRMGYA
ncbi:MAG: phage tail tape measure protein [Collimonas pratensis]|uniref:phage tail tape measure protein n=1 Tax=Collimonas pratensis TaxID=279113 RepID=UPI003C77C534